MLFRIVARAALVAAAFLAASAMEPAFAARTAVVVGISSEPPGLDPTVAAPATIRELTLWNVYEGLVRLDEKGDVQPLLARDWTISPDGLTYTFHLRPNVHFHNGVAFDSGVVKFTLDRARGTDSTNAQKQFFEPIDRIETPDPLTAVIVLKKPAGNLLYWLAWGDSVMVEPKSAATDRTDPVGTGPFRFRDWARGDHVDLVANPDYWGAKPELQTVTFRFISDAQAQAAALKAGDIQVFPDFLAPELFGDFQKDKRFGAQVGTTSRKVVAGMNAARKPFDDVRVRQALMQAVDRKAVIEGAYSGFGTPIGSHYAPSDPGYVDLTGVLPYDPAKAKALLAEAGYPNGFTATIKVPQWSETTRSAEILQAMLAQIGVTLNIVSSEFPAQWLQDVFKGGNFEMTIIDHAEPMDIGIYARPDYYFHYRNPAFDDVIGKAEATADAGARNALYGDAQTILAHDVPALYLFDLPRLSIADARLKGLWKNEPIPSINLADLRWED
ncbi:peptide/nickel transport system substrate-binding protein [Faunimonas pinastri]|uniref:Peptide/nickel transport system substrate-binding protein n=1 Tax=Faunimonas pinastri TaxID=1855383 RepID=A0A1H9A9V1_9HYPH|nr:ABC transporter substrate-binding protein [Faunimonas pinastri]SEP73439.1 peptide/nickel transport system substrate-binding protein [Faunimonas pinastri]